MARLLLHFRYLLLVLVFVPAVIWLNSPASQPSQEDQQLNGAVGETVKPLLPEDSKLHYLFAAVSATAFAGIGLLLLRRDRARISIMLGATVFTGTLGIMLLLAFQQFAENSTQEKWTGGPAFVLLHYIIQGIAYSYRVSQAGSGNVLIQLTGYIFGVGLCEETTKLLPVLFLLRNDPGMTSRDARLLGFFSGVGFGVAEGILYSQQQYNGSAPVLLYLVRFISCVGIHAMLTGTAAGLVARSNLALTKGFWPYFRKLTWIIMPLMILHAAYDTFCSRDFLAGALACELVLFLLFASQVEYDQPEGPFWRMLTSRPMHRASTVNRRGVDRILDKIRDEGLDALTETERETLRGGGRDRQERS
jgi:RsiW-degrading membrane proteinase PrsW (M82 family)